MGPETVSVDNPYGLAALWAQGDFVAKGTLILLALMSAYSWFIIFTKWWEQRRLLRQTRRAVQGPRESLRGIRYVSLRDRGDATDAEEDSKRARGERRLTEEDRFSTSSLHYITLTAPCAPQSRRTHGPVPSEVNRHESQPRRRARASRLLR